MQVLLEYEIEYPPHYCRPFLRRSDALEWESHGERAVVTSVVSYANRASVSVGKCAEGWGERADNVD